MADSAPIFGSLIAALALLALFIRIEHRTNAPMLPLALFRIPAFTGTALVAFAQSVALYPLLLFLSIYFQDALGLSPTGTGLRLLPITLVLFCVAPISGRLTTRVPLRLPLVTGLVLIACSLLLMRGVTPASAWTHLLPGFIIGGLAIGTISPALAAAMVSVLPVERSGLASGINNTFRQLGIAIGIAGLGAIFQHDTARPSQRHRRRRRRPQCGPPGRRARRARRGRSRVAAARPPAIGQRHVGTAGLGLAQPSDPPGRRISPTEAIAGAGTYTAERRALRRLGCGSGLRRTLAAPACLARSPPREGGASSQRAGFPAVTISVGNNIWAMYSRRISRKPSSARTGAASTPRQLAVKLTPRA